MINACFLSIKQEVHSKMKSFRAFLIVVTASFMWMVSGQASASLIGDEILSTLYFNLKSPASGFETVLDGVSATVSESAIEYSASLTKGGTTFADLSIDVMDNKFVLSLDLLQEFAVWGWVLRLNDLDWLPLAGEVTSASIVERTGSFVPRVIGNSNQCGQSPFTSPDNVRLLGSDCVFDSDGTITVSFETAFISVAAPTTTALLALCLLGAGLARRRTH